MATMIPAVIDPATASYGERVIFERLRDDPSTLGWIALHSLGMASHEKQVEGEIDFVVMIPGSGVLFLEVKGTSSAHLRRDEQGLWFYGADHKGDPRGPFKQARGAMHHFRNLLTAVPSLRGILFASGVIFPFAKFSGKSPEWHEWEFIDSSEFRSRPLGSLLRSLLQSWRDHLLAGPHPPRLDSEAPSATQVDTLAELLRPSFEIPVDPRSRRLAVQDETARFTAEQFAALDAMHRNPRVVFTGPAGTGKTLLAIEAARRATLSGNRIAFLCFNRMLGDWLKANALPELPGAKVGTLHAFMLELAGMEHAPAGAKSQFWGEELPSIACDRLLLDDASGENQGLDQLIVDEAQDILRDPYLDVLDLSLRGGLAAGNWRFFGDFENQSIYGSSSISLDQFIGDRAPGTPVFELGINCRNTPEIIQWVKLLAHLEPGYTRVRRTATGVVPSITFYSQPGEQPHVLARILENLYQEGYDGEDIVVVSPRASNACAAQLMTSPWRNRLSPCEHPRPGTVRYCSIHSFKGLEAAVIVVTDIESIIGPRDRSLFYIAATRPLERLYLIANEEVRQEALQTLGLTGGSGEIA